MKNPWTYIIANVIIAAVGALVGVNWPQLIGSHAAPFVIAAIAVANSIAHALAGAGPASAQGK